MNESKAKVSLGFIILVATALLYVKPHFFLTSPFTKYAPRPITGILTGGVPCYNIMCF